MSKEAKKPNENEMQVFPIENLINKDELYVLSGESLIKIQKLLAAQRMSSLVTINNTPVVRLKEIDKYLGLFRYINQLMNDILNSVTYADLRKSENVAIKEAEVAPKETSDSSEEMTDFNDTMEAFLKLKKIRTGGNINDGGAPSPLI